MKKRIKLKEEIKKEIESQKRSEDEFGYGEAFWRIGRDLRRKKEEGREDEKEKVCLLLLSPRGIKR